MLLASDLQPSIYPTKPATMLSQLSVAGLVMGPHTTSQSEIGITDSAALRTS